MVIVTFVLNGRWSTMHKEVGAAMVDVGMCRQILCLSDYSNSMGSLCYVETPYSPCMLPEHQNH